MRYAVLLLVLLPGLARAQLGALNTQTPYQLDVVLDVGKHRLLTDVFKEQVRRELEEGLQAGYGDLARIRVVDRAQLTKLKAEADTKERATELLTRLDEIRKDGLQKPLDEQRREIHKDGIKTHYVLIDYNDGQYEIQARQHCGVTGQASPVVRRDQTADRSFVSRLANILVDRDFGLVGVVQTVANQMAAIKLKGDASKTDFGRWIKKGDLFLIVPVPKVPVPTSPALNAVLQVTDTLEGGVCRCRVLDRFENAKSGSALKNERAASYRCLRIHAIKGPLRIRVMQGATGGGTPTPPPRTPVAVRRQGFQGEDATLLRGNTDEEGSFSTERLDQGIYDRLAFVQLSLAQTALVPIPIVDDRPALVRVAPQTQNQLLLVRKDLWEGRANDEGIKQIELFRRLKDIEDRPNERAKAINLAKTALESLKEEVKYLLQERDDIVKEAPDPKKMSLSFGNGWISFIQAGQVQLENYIKAQAEVVKEENDPKKLEFITLVSQGKLEEGRAEFDKALIAYRKAAMLPVVDESLKKHLQELEAKWQTKGDAHAAARKYIYETFPGLDLIKQPEGVKRAADAFNTCKAANDTLTPQKLMLELLTQAGKLKEVEKNLQDLTEDDKKTAETIIKLAKELKDLHEALEKFLPQPAK